MSTHIVLLLASILLLSLSIGGAAADTAAAPPADCTTQVLSLADCLSFVTAGSQVAKPEGACCPGLKTVLKSHAECLCDAFKNSAQFGVKLNVSKALALPAACHVSAPSVSNCGLSLVTGGAPASAPVGAMSPTVGSPTSSAPGSIEAAAPQPASSGSIAVAFSMGFLVILTVAVSFAF